MTLWAIAIGGTESLEPEAPGTQWNRRQWRARRVSRRPFRA